MSKLSHSHQPSMNLIERQRLAKEGIMPEPSGDALSNGENCVICWRPIECSGFLCACEECGGDGLIDEEATDEIFSNNGPFGVGA